MERIPMTPKGYEQLQEKLKRLKEEDLPRVQRAIGEALEHGDVSDNAELDAAREESRGIERRIAELERQNSLAEVIDSDRVPRDTIAIGATVVLEDRRRGGSFEYVLVGEGETREGVDVISVVSPLGQALIGRRESEEVEFQGPRGKLNYRILSFRYE